MAFTIKFDYRFDTSGFFSDTTRRTTLEAAAAEWEGLIQDEFADIPVGATLDVTDPSTGQIQTITLTEPIDDILIFAGARDLPGSSAAIAGPAGYNLSGDVFASRISNNFRDGGPVTDFEPWAGSLTFDSAKSWHYGMSEPPSNLLDFFTVALHEIGHVLGIGTSGTFDNLVVSGAGSSFDGINATALNGGNPIPLDPGEGHVADGFAGDVVLLDPILDSGTRLLPSEFDKAILADIGYQIANYVKQGSVPPLATDQGETIFGTAFADVIDGLGGDDQIQSAEGADNIEGGAGADTIFGGDGNDTLNGGADGDQIIGQNGEDLLNGDGGDDLLIGGSGADTLNGGAGDDQLQGGEGNDVLWGGAGNDSSFGQGGRDTFVLTPGDDTFTINDFDLASETIRFVDSGFADAAEALGALSKPFGNVSQITLSDGSYVRIFHHTQTGSPLTVANIEVVTSEPANVPPVGTPVIVGTALEGHTLFADVSDVDDADGLGNFSYIWLRDGVAFGPTGTSHVLGVDDIGAQISVKLEYVDGRGTLETLFTAATEPVENVNAPPQGSPIITGHATQGDILNVDASGISDADGLGTFTYAWLRNDIPTGETGSSYLLGAQDAGTRISVTVSFIDDQGTSETVTSAPTPLVEALVDDILIVGTEADDTLISGAGNDTINGNAGTDTATFAGNQASYTLSVGPEGTMITDRRTAEEGGQGADLLDSIELLDFGTEIPLYEGPMNLDLIDDTTKLSVVEFTQIAELYIAYFNRAPDAIGLYYWASEFERGVTLNQIADSLFDQVETRLTYADWLSPDGRTLVNVGEFVTEVYGNVLGREPDAGGFVYWVEELENDPAITPANFILALINGAKFTREPSEQHREDQAFLATKADIGVYYSAIKGLSNVEESAVVMANYDGTDDSVREAVDLVDAFYLDASDPMTGDFIFQLVGVLDDPFAIG